MHALMAVEHVGRVPLPFHLLQQLQVDLYAYSFGSNQLFCLGNSYIFLKAVYLGSLSQFSWVYTTIAAWPPLPPYSAMQMNVNNICLLIQAQTGNSPP